MCNARLVFWYELVPHTFPCVRRLVQEVFLRLAAILTRHWPFPASIRYLLFVRPNVTVFQEGMGDVQVRVLSDMRSLLGTGRDWEIFLRHNR